LIGRREQRATQGAAHGLLLVEHGGEHGLPGAVGLVDAAGDSLGVGHVAGYGVEPQGLVVHAGTGNTEYLIERHDQSPRRAVISPLNLLLRKVKLAWKSMAFSA